MSLLAQKKYIRKIIELQLNKLVWLLKKWISAWFGLKSYLDAIQRIHFWAYSKQKIALRDFFFFFTGFDAKHPKNG